MKNYVKAVISDEQGGSHAGETVEVLADDYTSKGDEELIEVKIDDDIIFVEKKFVSLKPAALSPAVEEDFTVPAVNSVSGVANVKEDEDEEELLISLSDLEDDIDGDGEKDAPKTDLELINIDANGNLDDEEDDDDKISITDLDDDDDDDDDDKDDDDDDDDKDDDDKGDVEVLRSKLQKSLGELEDIRSEMKNTFTSSDTISGTINSLKGMLDALKKDQENLRK